MLAGAPTVGGGIIALTLILVLLPFPRPTLYALITWTLLQNLPRSYLPGVVQGADLLDEVLLVAVTLQWTLPILIGRRSLKRTPLDALVLLFMAFYVVSCAFNRVPVVNGAFAFRDTFQYLLLFYAIVNLRFPDHVLRKCMKIVFALAAANFVALLLQLAVFYASTGVLFIEDDAVGLMGVSGAHKLGYFAAMLIMVKAAEVLADKKLQRGWLVVLALIVVLSSTRALLFWLPMSLLVLFSRRILTSPRLTLKFISVAGAFVGLMLLYVSLPMTQSATLNPTTLVRQQAISGEEGTSMQRIAFLIYSWSTLTEHNMLLGTGPGSYVSKTAFTLGSPLFTKYRDDFPWENSFRTGTQVSVTIVEYGILGSLLISLIYLRAYLFAGMVGRQQRNRNLKSTAFSVRGMIVLLMFSLWSNNMFELQVVMFLPWLLFGSLVSQIHSDKSDAADEDSTQQV